MNGIAHFPMYIHPTFTHTCLSDTDCLFSREVEKLLIVAAGHGIKEAQNLLENIRNRNLP